MRAIVNFSFFLLVQLSLVCQDLPEPQGYLPYDSSLIEIINNVEPISISSHTFGADQNGNAYAAIQLTNQMNYGNASFANMDSSNFSIAFWFRKDENWWPTTSMLRKDGYNFRYNGFFNGLEFFFTPNSDSAQISIGKSNVVQDSVWMHVAVTVDRDSLLQYYLNGALLDEAYIGNLSGFNVNSNQGNLIIGDNAMGLNDVYFFDKNLSPEEVQILYQGNQTGIMEQYASKLPSLQRPLHVHPNPCREFITMTVPRREEVYKSVSIFDSLGNLLKEFLKVSAVNGEIKLNVEEFPTGQYFLVAIDQQDLPSKARFVVH